MRTKFDSAIILCVLVPGTLSLLDVQYVLTEGVQLCASL